MQSLYYYSGSLTGSNLYLIPNNDDYSKYNEYVITDLIVCSSLYEILAFSGSGVLASFPIENTNIYYIATTESFFPPIPEDSTLLFTNIPAIERFTSSSFNWSFTPDQNIPSSANILIITGSQISLIQSQSAGSGYFQISSGSSLTITVSGSGNFYSSSIILYNNNAIVSESYASSIPASINFTASFEGFNYNIVAQTTTIPYVELTYNNESNIPISPTSSLSAWNSYLTTSASLIVNSGSTVYLVGGDANSVTSLILTDTSSANLTNLNIIGYPNISTLNISSSLITSLPSLENATNLQYLTVNNSLLTSSILPIGLQSLYFYDICNNDISDNISDILQNISQSIQIFSCSYNNITGSVPAFYNLPALGKFDCSNNQLSGSITSFSASSALSYFNCSNNALIDSIPSLNDCISLNYFNCSYNQLTGSIPNLQNNSILQYFNVSSNQLSDYSSGSIPSFLTYINGENNILSQSAIEGLVKDVYNAGAINGYLNLSGSGNSTASIDALYTASLLEIDRNWQVYLNGASTIFSASFSDNLFGFPFIPGISDGLTASYYSVVDTTLPLTYIYFTASLNDYKANFTVSDGNIYEVGLGGWYFVSGSSALYYSASVSILEISESITTTIFSGSTINTPISASFTGSAFATYLITGSITYSGSYYEDLIQYAEAIGL